MSVCIAVYILMFVQWTTFPNPFTNITQQLHIQSCRNHFVQMLTSLPVRRRIVLTGTPIQVSHVYCNNKQQHVDKFQNDLQEFYSIVEFCNPGILGNSIGIQTGEHLELLLQGQLMHFVKFTKSRQLHQGSRQLPLKRKLWEKQELIKQVETMCNINSLCMDLVKMDLDPHS